MATEFPANPTNGMIFEAEPGLFFVYEISTKSWVKVIGNEVFPLASPIRNGLMSSADLQKINQIVVPLPTSTIKSESCDNRFVSGNISIYGADDYMKISGTSLLTNKDMVGVNLPSQLTKNTGTFDFTIDKDKLFDELIARDQMHVVGAPGRPGPTGDQGPKGTKIATGPKGAKGDPGTSPPCTITISPDSLSASTPRNLNKAVVGIRTEQINETEFDIIVSLGVVGNPDAAPNRANVTATNNSTWVLAVERNISTNQQAYYIDLAPILIKIQEKFESEVLRLKTSHEDIIKYWLDVMAALYAQQSAVLCCALTACQGQLALEEQQKSSNLQNSIGDLSSALVTIAQQALPPALLGTISAPYDPTIDQDNQEQFVPQSIIQKKSDNIVRSLTILPENVGTIQQASSIDLPPGIYSIEISDCCLKFNDQYVADITVVYNHKGLAHRTKFLRPGHYRNLAVARRHYNKMTMEIDHYGGEVQAYMEFDGADKIDGGVVLSISRAGISDKEKQFSDNTIKEIDDTGSLSSKKLDEYERLWKDDKCFGLVTRVAGQDYILIRLSASGVSDCSRKFGQSAFLAWPTLDGHSFLKLGNKSFKFKKDEQLIKMVVKNINKSDFTSLKNTNEQLGRGMTEIVAAKPPVRLSDLFDTVIFPVLQ